MPRPGTKVEHREQLEVWQAEAPDRAVPGARRMDHLSAREDRERVLAQRDDGIIARVAKRAGIARKIGDHTLRRTGARLAHFSGMETVQIMAGLGHATEKQTIRYLGLTVMEPGKAQKKVYDYLEVIRARMKLRQGEMLVSNSEIAESSPRHLRVSR